MVLAGIDGRNPGGGFPIDCVRKGFVMTLFDFDPEDDTWATARIVLVGLAAAGMVGAGIVNACSSSTTGNGTGNGTGGGTSGGYYGGWGALGRGTGIGGGSGSAPAAGSSSSSGVSRGGFGSHGAGGG